MSSSATQRGFSKEAQYLDQTNKAANDWLRQAETFTKQPAYRQLGEVWEQCRQPNWDGESADAIEQETLRNAYTFIEALPAGFLLPGISGEPDGHIEFEWYREPRRILAVSVSAEGILYWAALFGTEDLRGSCHFYGDIPETLLYWISRVGRE